MTKIELAKTFPRGGEAMCPADRRGCDEAFESGRMITVTEVVDTIEGISHETS
jgi:hypothetical protein